MARAVSCLVCFVSAFHPASGCISVLPAVSVVVYAGLLWGTHAHGFAAGVDHCPSTQKCFKGMRLLRLPVLPAVSPASSCATMVACLGTHVGPEDSY